MVNSIKGSDWSSIATAVNNQNRGQSNAAIRLAAKDFLAVNPNATLQDFVKALSANMPAQINNSDLSTHLQQNLSEALGGNALRASSASLALVVNFFSSATAPKSGVNLDADWKSIAGDISSNRTPQVGFNDIRQAKSDYLSAYPEASLTEFRDEYEAQMQKLLANYGADGSDLYLNSALGPNVDNTETLIPLSSPGPSSPTSSPSGANSSPGVWQTLAQDVTLGGTASKDTIDNDIRAAASTFFVQNPASTLNSFIVEWQAQLLGQGLSAADYNHAGQYLGDVFPGYNATSPAATGNDMLKNFDLSSGAKSSASSPGPGWSNVAKDLTGNASPGQTKDDIKYVASTYLQQHPGASVNDFLREWQHQLQTQTSSPIGAASYNNGARYLGDIFGVDHSSATSNLNRPLSDAFTSPTTFPASSSTQTPSVGSPGDAFQAVAKDIKSGATRGAVDADVGRAATAVLQANPSSDLRSFESQFTSSVTGQGVSSGDANTALTEYLGPTRTQAGGPIGVSLSTFVSTPTSSSSSSGTSASGTNSTSTSSSGTNSTSTSSSGTNSTSTSSSGTNSTSTSTASGASGTPPLANSSPTSSYTRVAAAAAEGLGAGAAAAGAATLVLGESAAAGGGVALSTSAIELVELGETSAQVEQSLESLGTSQSDAQAAADHAQSHAVSQDQATRNVATVEDVAEQTRTLNPQASGAPQEAQQLAQELQQALPDTSEDANFASEAQQGLQNEASNWYPDNIEIENPLNGVDDTGQTFDNPLLQNSDSTEVFDNPLHADPTNPSANPTDFGKIADGVAAAGLTGGTAAAATQILATSKAAGGDVSQDDTATQLVDIGVSSDQAKTAAQNIGEWGSDVAEIQKSVDDTSKKEGTKSSAQIQDAVDAQTQLLSAENSAPTVGVAQGFVSSLADRVIGQDSQLSAEGVKLKNQIKGDAVQLGVKWGTKIKDSKVGQWLTNLVTPKTPITGTPAAVPNAREAGNTAYLADPDALPDLPVGHDDVSWSPTDDRELFNSDNPFASDVNSSEAGQGALGDCWFASVLQGIADRDPDFIKNNITVNHTDSGTTYTIPFYPPGSSTPVNVTVDGKIPMTDDEKHKYIGTAAGPIWPAIYEKAAAKFFSFTSRNNANGYDSLDAGYESQALSAITGPNNKNQYIKNSDGTFSAVKGNSADPSATISGSDALWDKINGALNSKTNDPRDNLLFSVFTDSVDHPGTGLLPSHSYGVVGASVQNGVKMVTLSNPHNKNDYTGGNETPGPNGEITVPFDHYVQNLSYIFT